MVYINTTTGCPERCAFCSSNTVWGTHHARASVTKTLDDIEFYVRKYNIRRIAFCDDTFNPSRKRVTELCQGIIDRKLDIAWSSAARVAPLDAELVALIKRSGCVSLEFGVESASARLRKSMRKNTSNGQIVNAFRLANNAHIDFLAFIMFGFPGENLVSIWQTLRLLSRIRPAMVAVSFCGRLPGTEFERVFMESGKFKDADYLIRNLRILQLIKKFTAYGAVKFLLVCVPSWFAGMIARRLIPKRPYTLHESDTTARRLIARRPYALHQRNAT